MDINQNKEYKVASEIKITPWNSPNVRPNSICPIS